MDWLMARCGSGCIASKSDSERQTIVAPIEAAPSLQIQQCQDAKTLPRQGSKDGAPAAPAAPAEAPEEAHVTATQDEKELAGAEYAKEAFLAALQGDEVFGIVPGGLAQQRAEDGAVKITPDSIIFGRLVSAVNASKHAPLIDELLEVAGQSLQDFLMMLSHSGLFMNAELRDQLMDRSGFRPGQYVKIALRDLSACSPSTQALDGKLAVLVEFEQPKTLWRLRLTNLKQYSLPLHFLMLLDPSAEFNARKRRAHEDERHEVLPFTRARRRPKVVLLDIQKVSQSTRKDPTQEGEAEPDCQRAAMLEAYVSAFATLTPLRKMDLVLPGPCWCWDKENSQVSGNGVGTVWNVDSLTGTAAVFWHDRKELRYHYQTEVRRDLQRVTGSTEITPVTPGSVPVGQSWMLKKMGTSAVAGFKVSMAGQQTKATAPDAHILVGEIRVGDHVAMPPGFCKWQETIIVIDWDDVLFPTTYLSVDLGFSLTQPLLQQKELRLRTLWALGFKAADEAVRLGIIFDNASRFLEDFRVQVEKTLRLAVLFGKVVLVTLGKPDWILQSCANFYPGLNMKHLMQEMGIRFVSARDREATRSPSSSPRMSRRQSLPARRLEGNDNDDGGALVGKTSSLRSAADGTASAPAVGRRLSDARQPAGLAIPRVPSDAKVREAGSAMTYQPSDGGGKARGRTASNPSSPSGTNTDAGAAMIHQSSDGGGKARGRRPSTASVHSGITDVSTSAGDSSSNSLLTTTASASEETIFSHHASSSQKDEHAWSFRKGQALSTEIAHLFGRTSLAPPCACRNIIMVTDSQLERSGALDALQLAASKPVGKRAPMLASVLVPLRCADSEMATMASQAQPSQAEDGQAVFNTQESSTVGKSPTEGSLPTMGKIPTEGSLPDLESPSASRLMDVRCKVVKVLDQPAGETLRLELKMLRRLLPKVVCMDEDFDLDLDGVQVAAHLHELDEFLCGSDRHSSSCARLVYGLGHENHGHRLLPSNGFDELQGKKRSPRPSSRSPRARRVSRRSVVSKQDAAKDSGGGPSSPQTSPRTSPQISPGRTSPGRASRRSTRGHIVNEW